MNQTLIVIGGGAAGFFCAINAAGKNTGLKVIIVEKSNKLLSKVRISGGGRCNVTHACFSIVEMTKKYPRGEKFLKQAFHHFFTNDTIDWFQKRDVLLKTEPDGRMFPESNSSETIINCLLQESEKYGIEILMNHEVVNIEKTMGNDGAFRINFKEGSIIQSEFICIACGGYPKALQYHWLSSLGHSFEAPVPSLFTFNLLQNPISKLMGISVNNAIIKINETKYIQQGPVLITHWGLSGPAILKLSAFAARYLSDKNYDFSITVNWLGDYHESLVLDKFRAFRHRNGSGKLINKIPFDLPQRLWQYHLEQCAIPKDIRWADLLAKQQNLLARQLCTQVFFVKGKTTFKEEFVTAGGIQLGEIDADTMQSKIHNGLYFAGEILNVDGITGGFNFQHAWTSGWIAGRAITEKLSKKLNA